MKTALSLFAALALAIATNASAAQGPDGMVLPAKPGNVTFNHKTHAAQKCTACHADDKGGDIKGIGADQNKDQAHAACLDCHKKEAKGPQKCAECHKKA
jgi:hypothetical protein